MTRARPRKDKTRSGLRPGEVAAWLWHHPQGGAAISTDEGRPRYWAHYYTASSGGRLVGPVRLATSGSHYVIAFGETPPKGFLWGDPSKQKYGIGGGFIVYGPIERRCRDCKALFIWPAAAQKHLFETIGATVDTIANRCHPCARARRALESARAAYAEALRELDATSAAAHLRVAKAVLAVLEAGGRASIDRAIGHCTRARRLGAASSVDAVERSLRARRASAP